MKRKVAVAGLGAATRSIHLPALAKLPDVEVVAGCDPAARAERLPFPVFPDAGEMLARVRPEILVVATPPATHFEVGKLGLEAGCHVFCEKPFAESLEEADALVALAERCGRHVVVNNQYRFMNIHDAAKRHVGAPGFGELLFVSMEQTFRVTETTEAGWRGKDPRRTCKEFGIHALDLCRFFFGSEPTSISARMDRGPDGAGPDMLDLMQLEFPGGRIAHVLLDRLCKGAHRYLDVRLDGSEGCIETSIGGRAELGVGIKGGARRPFLSAELSLGGRAHLLQGDRVRRIASDPLDLFASATRKLFRAMLDALDAGRVPPCAGADNRRTLALMLAAYESDRLRAPVALAP